MGIITIKKLDNHQTLKTLIISCSVFSFIILVWELAVYFTNASRIVIVPPSEIYPVIFKNQDILLKELIFTFEEVLAGWSTGSLIAIVLAIFIHPFRRLSQIFIGVSVGINAIPLIALAAILGGIVGTGQTGKAIIVALLCFFPMFISCLKSFTHINLKERNLLQTYSASYFQQFTKLIFPSSLPLILTTLKVNIIVAIFAGVVSEFFGAHGGIGNLILAKKGLYDLPMVWAAIFYIIVAGSICYFSVELAYKLMVPWRK